MLERLTISLSESERVALQRVAESDLRSIRDEARLFLRRELQRRGFLESEVSLDQRPEIPALETEANGPISGDEKEV